MKTVTSTRNEMELTVGDLDSVLKETNLTIDNVKYNPWI